MSSDSLYDVVVFSPHPDDAEMTIAGTIIRLVRSGRRVLSVALTGGEKGTFGDAQTRAKEFAAANAVMGSDGRILDFPGHGGRQLARGTAPDRPSDPRAPAADRLRSVPHESIRPPRRLGKLRSLARPGNSSATV